MKNMDKCDILTPVSILLMYTHLVQSLRLMDFKFVVKSTQIQKYW